MHTYLSSVLPPGAGVNFIAHSMGGLDVRHLISTIRPTNYKPLSLTSIGTPHRGSPFMDWCAANIGVGYTGDKALLEQTKAMLKQSSLPFSLKSPLLSTAEAAMEQVSKDGKNGSASSFAGFTGSLSKYLLNIFDSPAYANLTTSYVKNHFNPSTPDDPSVKYISVAGRVSKLSVFHPLWFPKLVLDASAEKGYYREQNGVDRYEGNDGLVNVSSAKWGEFIGAVDDTHHWDLRGEGGLWPTGMEVVTGEEEKKKEKQMMNEKKMGEGERNQEYTMSGGWDWDHWPLDIQDYLGLGDGQKAKDPASSSSSSSSMPNANASERDPNAPKVNVDGLKSKEESLKRQPALESNTSSSSGASSMLSKATGGGIDVGQVGQVLDWVTDLVPGGKSSESGKRQLEEMRGQKDDIKRIERNKERERLKKKKEEFDLARFYGGLMLKLREEGF